MAENKTATASASATASFPVFGLLTVALVVLKLLGYISISWWWIVLCFFAPLILFVAFMLVLGAFAGIALTIAHFWEKHDRKKARQEREKRQAEQARKNLFDR